MGAISPGFHRCHFVSFQLIEVWCFLLETTEHWQGFQTNLLKMCFLLKMVIFHFHVKAGLVIYHNIKRVIARPRQHVTTKPGLVFGDPRIQSNIPSLPPRPQNPGTFRIGNSDNSIRHQVTTCFFTCSLPAWSKDILRGTCSMSFEVLLFCMHVVHNIV